MKRKKDDQALAAAEDTNGTAAAAAVETQERKATSQREAGDDGDERSFPPTPNPFGTHHNNLAGVEISNYADKENKIYETWLKFRDGKPSEAVRAYMKQNGFRWQGSAPKGGHFDVAGAWALEIPYVTRNATRLKGERVFAGVVNMILEEKGLTPEPELQQQF